MVDDVVLGRLKRCASSFSEREADRVRQPPPERAGGGPELAFCTASMAEGADGAGQGENWS